jgi:hypothetical protein
MTASITDIARHREFLEIVRKLERAWPPERARAMARRYLLLREVKASQLRIEDMRDPGPPADCSYDGGSAA